MSILKEFKEFAVKGNAVDLAVGIIVGGAFGTLVKSLVDDVIMPPIGLLIGKVDFSNLYILLEDGPKQGAPYASLNAAKQAGAVTLNLGLFLNTVVSFTIMAFAVFMLVKFYNELRGNSVPEPEANEKVCPFCATNIPVNASRCPHCTSEITN